MGRGVLPPTTSAMEKHHAKLVPRNKRCRECSCKATIEVVEGIIRAAAFPYFHIHKNISCSSSSMATVMHIFHPGHRSEREGERSERVVLAAAAFNVSGSSAPRAPRTRRNRSRPPLRQRRSAARRTVGIYRVLMKQVLASLASSPHKVFPCESETDRKLTMGLVCTMFQSREGLVAVRARCRAPREYFERRRVVVGP